MVVAVLVQHHPVSAAVVRRQLAADLADRSLAPACVDDAVLVASELVGNAILHTDAQLAIEVAWDIEDTAVIIRVGDGSPDRPLLRRPSTTALGGRGLAIVAALSSDWGVAPTADGKQVWARVTLRRAA
jgi:anti-sigma regulatory factor (Ser/Thr protein kinase)